MKASIRLIHWNDREAAERAERLRALGYAVNDAPPNGPTLLKELAQEPPAALVIDLSRLPSQGRDVGVSLRQRQAFLPARRAARVIAVFRVFAVIRGNDFP